MFLCKFFIVFLIVSYVFGYKRHVKIVGGKKAPLGKFPYKASMQYNDKHVCGGSIISNRWILTAAHCISSNETYTVLVGTVTLDKGGVRYPIIKQIIHKRYSARFVTNDIGMLKTKTEISFSNYVSTIALGAEHVKGGVNVLLSGWGMISSPNPQEPPKRTNELLYVKLKTITNQECTEAKPIGNVLFWPNEILHICTFTKIDEGPCFGDSGGALVNEDNDKLVGIVSGGMIPKKCARGYPDFYTRVSSFISWVEKNMKENS